MMRTSLTIQTFVDGLFGENSLVLFARDQTDCWIVDPGFESEGLCGWVAQRGLRPVLLIDTHCHVDHVAGNEAVKNAFPDVTLCAPCGEADMLTDPVKNLSQPFGAPLVSPPADRELSPGDELTLGPLSWRVLDLSGHSPGGIGLYCRTEALAIVGDAVFEGSVGRTDFPGSDHARLIRNIKNNLLTLPDETRLLSGHGPATTVAAERTGNPYLSEDVAP